MFERLSSLRTVDREFSIERTSFRSSLVVRQGRFSLGSLGFGFVSWIRLNFCFWGLWSFKVAFLNLKRFACMALTVSGLL